MRHLKNNQKCVQYYGYECSLGAFVCNLYYVYFGLVMSFSDYVDNYPSSLSAAALRRPLLDEPRANASYTITVCHFQFAAIN